MPSNNSFKPRPLRGSAHAVTCTTPPCRKSVQLNSGVSLFKSMSVILDGKLIVRRAESRDAAEISACLLALGYATSEELVCQKLALLLGTANDAIFVAQDPNSSILLGVASAHVFQLFHAPGQITRLTSLAVRAGAHGKGVGRELVAAVEAWSWASGARRVEVTSGDHRPEAHSFYQAIGYSLDERRFIKHAPERAG